MQRREVIGLLAGAAAWPLAARAQHSPSPSIGVLHQTSPAVFAPLDAAFRKGLKEAGFVEGHNVRIEYRWARESPCSVAGISGRSGSSPSGGNHREHACDAGCEVATAMIPIVFVSADDPVRLGLVASFNRPGGNATGVYFLIAALEAKRAQLVHELVPKADMIALLVDPNFPSAEAQSREVQEAARSLGLNLLILKAGTESDLDTAFATLVRERAGALAVAATGFYFFRREQLVALAARHALPAAYPWREAAAAGGLMSYGTSVTDAYRQGGIYAGRILKGEKPADLPVQQLVKIELVINLKTAKALGLDVPMSMLMRVDEVIE
jgi:putative ABC transport system substrate-binding protein